MGMDEKCELATLLVDYIWYSVKHADKIAPPHHSLTDDNGDVRYVDEAQDIFNRVLDNIDSMV